MDSLFQGLAARMRWMALFTAMVALAAKGQVQQAWVARYNNGITNGNHQGLKMFPSQSFDLEASSDLLNWLQIGSFVADTSGLMQFDDSSATNFGSRFYRAKPQ
jgi:hypothetical protein